MDDPAYERGYKDGESSVTADVYTLCEQLGIAIDDQSPFEAISSKIIQLREALRTARAFVEYEFEMTDDGGFFQDLIKIDEALS